ncbi:hypothetical protein GN956_G19356 [Arapaima gigas]
MVNSNSQEGYAGDEEAKRARRREKEMARKKRRADEEVNRSIAEVRQMEEELLHGKWTERPGTHPDEDLDIAVEVEDGLGSRKNKEPGQYRLTVTGNVRTYVPWSFMDSKGPSEQLDQGEGGQRWITAFEEQTAGRRLTLGGSEGYTVGTATMIEKVFAGTGCAVILSAPALTTPQACKGESR